MILINKTLEDILLFYNNNDSELSLEDIYYYIYHLKRNKGANGKYSDKFKNLFKGWNMNIIKIYSEKIEKNIILMKITFN